MNQNFPLPLQVSQIMKLTLFERKKISHFLKGFFSSRLSPFSFNLSAIFHRTSLNDLYKYYLCKTLTLQTLPLQNITFTLPLPKERIFQGFTCSSCRRWSTSRYGYWSPPPGRAPSVDTWVATRKKMANIHLHSECL